MGLQLSKNKKINISVLISVFTLIASFLTSFLFTKFLLKQPQIGDVNYGLKVTAGSIVSFISIFTAGMASTFIRFKNKYNDDEQSVVSTFNLVTLVIAVVTIIFGLIMFILTINNKIIDPKGGVYAQKQVYEFAVILAISILYSALSISISTSRWFMESCKHIVLVRIVELAVTILYPLISIPIVLLGGNMIAVTVVYSVVYLAGFVFFFVYRAKKVKYLNFLKIKASKEILKDIVIFSLFVIVASATQTFSFSLDKVLLTATITASLTTMYQLGITLHQVMMSVVLILYGPYVPYLAEDITYGKNEDVQKMYNKVTLILLLISCLLFCGFAACGKEFVYLWVGKDKEIVYYFALILFSLWPLYSMVLFSGAIHKLHNKHYKSTILFVIAFIIHLILTVSLVRVINIWACIIGTAVSYLFLGVSFLVYNKKEIHLSQKYYLINLFKMVICAGAAYGLTYLLAKVALKGVDLSTTKLFLFEGCLSVLFFALLLIGMYYKIFINFVKRLFSEEYSQINYNSHSYLHIIKEKLEFNKDKVNRIFPFVIILYFIFNFASYYLGGIPGFSGFINSTAFALLSKGISYFIFIAYVIAYVVANKCSLDLRRLLCFTAVFFASILACIVVPKHVEYITTNSYKWTIRVIIDIGVKDLLIGTLNWLIDLFVLFSYLFLFRQKIKKKDLYPFLFFITIFAVAEIFYSFIFQYKQYLSLITGGSIATLNISGTFVSKNGFGFLLFQAVIACYFVIQHADGKKKILYWCMYAFINIVNILALCKTSIVAILIFNIVIFVRWLVKLRAKRKEAFSVCLAFIIVSLIICGLSFGLASSSDSIMAKIANKILKVITYGNDTFKSRFIIWDAATKLLRGPYLIFGYGKTPAMYFMSAAYNLNSSVFHNGFLSILCSYGVIGLVLYIFAIYYVIKNILKSKDVDIKIILMTIIIITILYGMMENTYLFISSSSVMLVPNVILSVSYEKEKSGVIYG